MVDLVCTSRPVEEAARRIAEALRVILDSGREPRFAVPGGSAAAALGPVRRHLGDRWGRVRLTWVDERLAPLDHPESNRGAALAAGHLHPDDPPAAILPLVEDGESVTDALRRSTAGFVDGFGGALDVVLLGLGEDGHVASLFPGHPALRNPGPLVAVWDSPKPPPVRLSFSLAVLASAPVSVLLAMGEGKRAALARLLRGDPDLPAAHLPFLTVVTDLEHLS